MNTRQALPIAMIVGGVSALGFLVLALAIREFGRSRRAEAGVDGAFDTGSSRTPTIRRGLLTESDRVLRAVDAWREREDRAPERAGAAEGK